MVLEEVQIQKFLKNFFQGDKKKVKKKKKKNNCLKKNSKSPSFQSDLRYTRNIGATK